MERKERKLKKNPQLMENKMAKEAKAENMVSAPAPAAAGQMDHDQIYQALVAQHAAWYVSLDNGNKLLFSSCYRNVHIHKQTA